MTEQTGIRHETGVLQLEGDWPGIFIRGDDALSRAAAIRAVLREADDAIRRGNLRPVGDRSGWVFLDDLADLAELLESCRVKPRAA
jgi:hypothetical protein